MDGTLENACSKLELSKTTKFHLAPGEELVVCPYDMAHIVTNHRMTVHIVKCRRNYEKAMKANDDMVQMVACKYNWAHQVPVPELVYHEITCVDRLTLITHIIEYSEPDPRHPDKLKQLAREIYVTKGVPFVEVRPVHNFKIVDDSVISNHLMPRKVNSVRQPETFEVPQLRLKTAPKASRISVKSVVSTGSKSSAAAATFHPPGESTPSKGNTSIGATDGSMSTYQDNLTVTTAPVPGRGRPPRNDSAVNKYYFDAKDQPEAKNEYEWELDPPLRPYDPMKRFETEMLLKYPSNMSKSERKAWKNANVAKVKKLYGGHLIHMAAAELPPGMGGLFRRSEIPEDIPEEDLN